VRLNVVGPGCEDHVFAAQTGEFGDTQTGLGCDGEQRVVATTDPGVLLGNSEDRPELLFGQERNDVAIESFLWDRQGPPREIRSACSGCASAAGAPLFGGGCWG
jgi:hypothetical protein